MHAALMLWCAGGLLATGGLAVTLSRTISASVIVYAGSLALSLIAFSASLGHLVAAQPTSTALLPLGLPWLGAHFRIDELAAFFLAVINLGGALACLYGIGYGRHESAPHRVLPFLPAF